MFACCAAPAQSGAGVEIVPLDSDAIKAPAGSAQTRTLLTKTEAPQKRGLTSDGANSAGLRVVTSLDINDAQRFDKYDRQTRAPTWGGDERRSTATRSRRAGGGGNSPQEDNNKEERMKELMAEFRPMLASGIRVDMVDTSTQLFSQCLCKMDTASKTVHFTSAFMDEQVFDVKDMIVFKGSEFTRKVPSLAHIGSKCVGMEFPDEASNCEPICFHFEDSAERNDFYAFMKIMRLTMDSVGVKHADSLSANNSANHRSRRSAIL